MDKAKNIKIILGSIYIVIICIFLWYFFKYFSLKDFTSYELIKSNIELLNQFKNTNLIFSLTIFFIFTIFWVVLLGFGSPIFLMGGFIFGKWIGTLVVLLGLTTGATLLYIMSNYFLKELIYNLFISKFYFLVNKFKKNEFLYFIIYRAIGGIPFFIQNILPTLFNISVKKYFFGSLIGLAPQLFIGTSLGSGLSKVLENNNEPPSFFQMILTPDIYIPILALVIFFIIALILRKKFFKNDGAPTQN